MDVGMDGHLSSRPYNDEREVAPLLKNRPKVSKMDNDHHTDEIAK